ncbi:Uncharacterised protein [Vibrio cholerae]|nr:Uncharacterised protein [Vibrio cholerae]
MCSGSSSGKASLTPYAFQISMDSGREARSSLTYAESSSPCSCTANKPSLVAISATCAAG